MWRQRAATESNLRASTPLGPDARRHSFSIPPKLHRVDEENESSNATPRKKSVSWGSELNHAGQPPPPAEFIAGASVGVSVGSSSSDPTGTGTTSADDEHRRSLSSSSSGRRRSDTAELIDTLRTLLRRHPSYADKLGVVMKDDATSADGVPRNAVPPPLSSRASSEASSTYVTDDEEGSVPQSPVSPPLMSPAASAKAEKDWQSARKPRARSLSFSGQRLRGGFHPVWRRTFYVLVTLALLLLGRELWRIKSYERERQMRDAEERQVSRTFRQIFSNTVAVQAALIAVNLCLAVRGVQIWKLLQDVDAVGWVQRISPHMQAAEGAMRVVNVAAKPFQGIFRGIRLPLKPFAARRAQRAALELVKLEQAAATATVTGRMKGAFSPLLGGAKKVASIAGNVATRIE